MRWGGPRLRGASARLASTPRHSGPSRVLRRPGEADAGEAPVPSQGRVLPGSPGADGAGPAGPRGGCAETVRGPAGGRGGRAPGRRLAHTRAEGRPAGPDRSRTSLSTDGVRTKVCHSPRRTRYIPEVNDTFLKNTLAQGGRRAEAELPVAVWGGLGVRIFESPGNRTAPGDRHFSSGV